MRRRCALYLSDEELDLIEEAAWRRGVKRSEWIRGVAVSTAEKTIAETGGTPLKRPNRRKRKLATEGGMISVVMIFLLSFTTICPIMLATGTCWREQIPILRTLDERLGIPDPRM